MERQSNSERLANTKNRFVAVNLTKTTSKLEYEIDRNSRERLRTKRYLKEFLLTVNQTSGYLVDNSLGETNNRIPNEVANNDIASEDDKKIAEPNGSLRRGSSLESIIKPAVLDFRQKMKLGEKAKHTVEMQRNSTKEQLVGEGDNLDSLVEKAKLSHFGVSPPSERRIMEVPKSGAPLLTKRKLIQLHEERRHSKGNVSDKRKNIVAGIPCRPSVTLERRFPYSTSQRAVLTSESKNNSCNVLLPPTLQKQAELRRPHSVGGLDNLANSSDQEGLFALKQEKTISDDRHRDYWRKNHYTKKSFMKANSGNVRTSIHEGKKQDRQGMSCCFSPVLLGRSSADKQGAG